MTMNTPPVGSDNYYAMKLYEEHEQSLDDDAEPDFFSLPGAEQLKWKKLALVARKVFSNTPVAMILTCPDPRCGMRHIDEGEFATKPHHTHACQSCGMVWRPSIGPTIGVQFLPGFKNDA